MLSEAGVNFGAFSRHNAVRKLAPVDHRDESRPASGPAEVAMQDHSMTGSRM